MRESLNSYEASPAEIREVFFEALERERGAEIKKEATREIMSEAEEVQKEISEKFPFLEIEVDNKSIEQGVSKGVDDYFKSQIN